jgi:hypothetical protein
MADETQTLLTELVGFLSSDRYLFKSFILQLNFFSNTYRADVKQVALDHIVGFTATDDGKKILKALDVVTPLCKLLGDKPV